MIDQLILALLLERDDERNEDVDEEERKHDEIDDVEDGHLNAKARLWSAILVRSVYRMLQYAVHKNRVGYIIDE